MSPELGRRLVEAVIGVMALEFVVLSLRGRRRGSALVTAALALAPGFFLVLALRLALGGADFAWIGLCLALSLPCHLADLGRRGLLSRKKAGDP